MNLPDVKMKRKGGQLKRTVPTEEKVIGMVLSGVAVAGKIALAEPKQVFSTDQLAALGITAAENPFAFAEISDYYAAAGEGAELNFMLVSDATSMADTCNIANNQAKKLIDFMQGRCTVLVINRKLPAGYVMNQVDGLDTDVWSAIANLDAMGLYYDEELNTPFIGLVPGIGFTKATLGNLRNVGTMSNDYVAAPVLAAVDNTGRVGMGRLAGWIVKNELQHNIARVRSGAVIATDAAYFPDGTLATHPDYNAGVLGSIHTKRYIIWRKWSDKSGFFYNDDPCANSQASDFSSISWSAVINKAKRIAVKVLRELINDDVDIDETTGKILPSVASDWEGDVERELKLQMKNKKQITSATFKIDVEGSDITNDEVKYELRIVRKGQAKIIDGTIGFSTIS